MVVDLPATTLELAAGSMALELAAEDIAVGNREQVAPLQPSMGNCVEGPTKGHLPLTVDTVVEAGR